MKNFLKATLIGLLIGTQAYAGLPPTNIKGQNDATATTKFSLQVPYSQFTDLGGVKALIETGNTNVLANPSFEAPGITTSSVPSWTLGTNVTAAANTSSYKDGKQAVTLSTNVTGVTGAQVLFYQSLTPGSYDANVNKIARLWVNTSITTLQVCAYLASGTVNCQAVPSSSTWQSVTSNFIMPSSGTIGVALYTTAAIAASTTIAVVDKAEVKDADNLSQVSQTQFVGSAYIPTTSGCFWNGPASTSLGAFSSSAGCSSTATIEFNPGPGVIQAATGNLPQITVNNLPPGYYEVKSTFHNSAASGSPTIGFAINDGTTSSGGASTNSNTENNQTTVVAYFNYTTSGNRTFAVWSNAATSNAQILNNSTGFDQPIRFSIIQYPTQSQTGLRADQTPATAGSQATDNVGLAGSTSSSTAGVLGSISGSLTNISTPRNITCTTASGTVGVTCALPVAGNYHVCYSGYAYNSVGGSDESLELLVDGSGSTIVGAQEQAGATANNSNTFGGCNNHYFNAGSNTIQVYGRIIGGGTSTFDLTTISINGADATTSAPYLTGSVTSNTSGQERVERAHITGSASPSIDSQSGSWATISSRFGAGDYFFTFSGFSSKPACVCAAEASSSNGVCKITVTSSTAAEVNNVNMSNANVDQSFSLICMGPR